MVKFILIKPNDLYPDLKSMKTKKDKNHDLELKENNLFKLKSNYIDMEKFRIFKRQNRNIRYSNR